MTQTPSTPGTPSKERRKGEQRRAPIRAFGHESRARGKPIQVRGPDRRTKAAAREDGAVSDTPRTDALQDANIAYLSQVHYNNLHGTYQPAITPASGFTLARELERELAKSESSRAQLEKDLRVVMEALERALDDMIEVSTGGKRPGWIDRVRSALAATASADKSGGEAS